MRGADRDARPGQVLDGRFLLTEAIGRGGMATVFKAIDLAREGETVAVKVLLPLFSSGLGTWSIFQHEEEIGLRFDHPFIVKFVPLVPDRRRSYMVTELVPGRTLAEYLREQHVLPEKEALSLASQLCEALDHVHGRGVVHYDIKPANIILCPDRTIRLVDFGLAHAAADPGFSLHGAPPAIGSVPYVAPEQIRRKRGRKSVDIYAIGTVLYEMLTGRLPYPEDAASAVTSDRILGDPPAPRRCNPRISPQTEDIVLRALRRRPRERYASAAAMKADLDAPDMVVVAGFCDRLQPVTRWRRTLGLLKYIAVAVLLPVALQFILFALLWYHFARKP